MKERKPLAEIHRDYGVLSISRKPVDLTEKHADPHDLAIRKGESEQKIEIFCFNLVNYLEGSGALYEIGRTIPPPVLSIRLNHAIAKRSIALAAQIEMLITTPEKARPPRIDTANKEIRIDLWGIDDGLIRYCAEVLATCIQIAEWETYPPIK